MTDSNTISELTTRELATLKAPPDPLSSRTHFDNGQRQPRIKTLPALCRYGHCLSTLINNGIWNRPAMPYPHHSSRTQLPVLRRTDMGYCWWNIQHLHNPFCHLKTAKVKEMVSTSLSPFKSSSSSPTCQNLLPVLNPSGSRVRECTVPLSYLWGSGRGLRRASQLRVILLSLSWPETFGNAWRHCWLSQLGGLVSRGQRYC